MQRSYSGAVIRAIGVTDYERVMDAIMQKRYWDYMVDVKLKLEYVDLLTDNMYIKNIAIALFCAIMSTASIGAWFQLQKLAFLWAPLFAAFQVLNAVKSHLPYSIALTGIFPAQKKLKLLYNKIEHNWFRVESGALSETEINDMLFDFKNKCVEIESGLFNGHSLLPNKRLEKKANSRTDAYFKEYFNIPKAISEKEL